MSPSPAREKQHRLDLKVDDEDDHKTVKQEEHRPPGPSSNHSGTESVQGGFAVNRQHMLSLVLLALLVLLVLLPEGRGVVERFL